MSYLPLGSNTYRRIPDTPIYRWEDDSYEHNICVTSYTFPNTTKTIPVFFAITSVDYTPEYDEEYFRSTIRIWLPSHTFTTTYNEHYYR